MHVQMNSRLFVFKVGQVFFNVLSTTLSCKMAPIEPESDNGKGVLYLWTLMHSVIEAQIFLLHRLSLKLRC